LEEGFDAKTPESANPEARKPGSLEMKLPRVSISGLPASLKKNIPHKVSKKKNQIKSELSGSE